MWNFILFLILLFLVLSILFNLIKETEEFPEIPPSCDDTGSGNEEASNNEEVSNKHYYSADEAITSLQQTSDQIFAAVLDDGATQFRDNSKILGAEDYSKLEAAQKYINRHQTKLQPESKANLEFIIGRDDYIDDKLDPALDNYQSSLTFWQQKDTEQDSQENTESTLPKESIHNPKLKEAAILSHIGLCNYRKAQLNEAESDTNLQEACDYFEQCVTIFGEEKRPDLAAKFISQWQEVLLKQKNWEQLEIISQEYQQIIENNGTAVQVAQNYGFLAEVAIERQNWAEAKELAQKSLQALETLPEAQKPPQSWYLLLLAKAQRQLGEVEEAVTNLEGAKSGASEDNLQLYIDILEELKALYVEQSENLKEGENQLELTEEQLAAAKQEQQTLAEVNRNLRQDLTEIQKYKKVLEKVNQKNQEDLTNAKQEKQKLEDENHKIKQYLTQIQREQQILEQSNQKLKDDLTQTEQEQQKLDEAAQKSKHKLNIGGIALLAAVIVATVLGFKVVNLQNQLKNIQDKQEKINKETTQETTAKSKVTQDFEEKLEKLAQLKKTQNELDKAKNYLIGMLTSLGWKNKQINNLFLGEGQINGKLDQLIQAHQKYEVLKEQKKKRLQSRVENYLLSKKKSRTTTDN
ncbi:MAG: tetratricopeptide repeat protein [Moorea sp. SIO2B7]|nr:tetratricopeptide repeat protein [Moorena sp. SIO2B7]